MSKLAVPNKETGEYDGISSYFFKYDDLGLPVPKPEKVMNNYTKCKEPNTAYDKSTGKCQPISPCFFKTDDLGLPFPKPVKVTENYTLCTEPNTVYDKSTGKCQPIKHSDGK